MIAMSHSTPLPCLWLKTRPGDLLWPTQLWVEVIALVLNPDCKRLGSLLYFNHCCEQKISPGQLLFCEPGP